MFAAWPRVIAPAGGLRGPVAAALQESRSMASLYKPWVMFHRTPDGRRCRSDTPGARLHCTRSRLWYGEYQDVRGGWHRVPLDAAEDTARCRLEELLHRDQLRTPATQDASIVAES
jgi:hypothetical protein